MIARRHSNSENVEIVEGPRHSGRAAALGRATKLHHLAEFVMEVSLL